MADRPPPPIGHRSLQQHYNKSVTHIPMAVGPLLRYLPQISATPLHQISFIYRKMHIYPWKMDPPPLPIDHRSLQHHYSKSATHIEQCIYTHGRQTPHQLTIDLCNTTTMNQLYIYPWKMDPSPGTDHRSLQHHYTKSASHIEECTYTDGRQTPSPTNQP